MRLRYSVWSLAIVLAAGGATAEISDRQSRRRSTNDAGLADSEQGRGKRRTNVLGAASEDSASSLNVEAYLSEHGRILDRLNDLRRDRAAVDNGRPTAAADAAADGPTQIRGATTAAKDTEAAGQGGGARRRARAAAASSAALDLGNGLKIGQDSYDDGAGFSDDFKFRVKMGDGRDNNAEYIANPKAKVVTTAEEVPESALDIDGKQQQKQQRPQDRDSSISSSTAPINIDASTNAQVQPPESNRDKLINDRGGGGGGNTISVHHRISGGGALEIFPLPTDPPTMSPVTSSPTSTPTLPRYTAGTATGSGGSIAGLSDDGGLEGSTGPANTGTTTTTTPPNGGVKDELEQSYERKCTTVTSMADIYKAIADATYWSSLIGPALVRLCPFHITNGAENEAAVSATTPMIVSSPGTSIVCDKSDNLYLSQQYAVKARHRLPQNNEEHFKIDHDYGQQDCIIEGTGRHVTIAADYVTLMGMEFRGSTESAVQVEPGVKGTTMLDCTFDGNALPSAMLLDGVVDEQPPSDDDPGVVPPTMEEVPPSDDDPSVVPIIRARGLHGSSNADISHDDDHHDHDGGAASINRVGAQGGAAINLGADTSGTLVSASKFSHNASPGGGAITAVESELAIYDSLFTSNRATDGNGGAILMLGDNDLYSILHVTQTSWMFNSIRSVHGDDDHEENGDHHHGPIIFSEGLVCDAGSNYACMNGESEKSPADSGSGINSFNVMFSAECNGLSNHDTACKNFGHVCEASETQADEDLSGDSPFDLSLEFGGGGQGTSSSGVPQVGSGGSISGEGSQIGIAEGEDAVVPTFIPTSVPTASLSAAPTNSVPTTSSPTKKMVCSGNMDAETREILIRLTITAVTDEDDLIPTGISFTPQWRAFRWLIDEDELHLCPGVHSAERITQRYTIAVLYYSTGGDNWTRCSRDSTTPCIVGGRFLGSNSECVWYGIDCDTAGMVFRIDFENTNMVGSIASELGSLNELKSLALEKGSLSGSIPSTLGQLTKLEALDLDYNSLYGAIPQEITGAQALKMIDLNDNELTGGLEHLASFNNLERLWVHSNAFTGTVPSLFGDLERLSTLSLYDNDLSGTIAQSICAIRPPNGSLTSLEADCFKVQCSCCSKCHTSAPTSSPSMSPTASPTRLPSGHPSFSPSSTPTIAPTGKPTTAIPTIPPTDGPTESPTPIPTPIPSAAPTASPTVSMAPTHQCMMEVTLRDALITIELQSVSHPLDLADITKPQWMAKEFILRYDGMNLCPDDPRLIQRYVMVLFYISTGGNDWVKCSANRSSPCETNVRWLNGHECFWYGVACINGVLDQITMDGNNVVGELPHEISSLSKLRSISLENGGLSGTLPASLGELQELVKIDLDYNSLTGPIPSELAFASNLLVLDLNNNGLTGPIDFLGQIRSIRFVQLHNNMLSGQVPATVSNLEDLEALELHNNSFVGDIPVEICGNRDVVGGTLKHLRADCAPSASPQISCSCCTMCYPLTTSAPSIPPPTSDPTSLPTATATGVPSGTPTVDCNMSAEERMQLIQSILEAVSDPLLLANGQTAQGKAMDWIIFFDEKYVCPSSPTLVQRYVLALFYYSTLGDEWSSCFANSGMCPANDFLSRDHECTWQGIACDDSDMITEIVFESNNVAGVLPDELSALSSLKVLSLEKGALGGAIPATFGLLSDLEVLDLDFNALTGAIPEQLAFSSKLQMIDLNDNLLTGGIDVLANIPSLRFIDVHSTGVSGTISAVFASLSQLEVLIVHSTNLEGSVPIGVCGLPSLTSVQADCADPVQVQCSCCTLCYPLDPTTSPTPSPSAGSLSSSDATIQEKCGVDRSTRALLILSSLSGGPEASVSDSSLMLTPSTPQGKAYDWILNIDPMTLCPDASNLAQRYVLVVLYYYTNGDNWFSCYQGSDPLLCVQGSVDAGAGPEEARDPFLSGTNECSWGGIVCEDDAVTEIRFETNNLGGMIPDELSSLSSLKALALENGVLIGTVPSSLGSLTSLEELDLNQNVLTGTLPLELAQISSLRILDMDNNMLTGSIDPVAILPNLEYVQLHDNLGLTGTVPFALGSRASLTGVFLQGTGLSGTLPSSFCDNLASNGGSITYLEADCSTLSCSCCTNCEGGELLPTADPTTITGRGDGDGNNVIPVATIPTVPAPTSFRTDEVGTVPLPTTLVCGVSEAERAERIRFTLFTYISDPTTLEDTVSPQSKALAWIVYIDSKRICHFPATELVQRYVAAVFYFATDGDSWSSCSHDSDPTLCPLGAPFLSGTHECFWGGISCSGDEITEIVFDSNNLGGYLPQEIASLKALKVLSLEKGSISGSIPPSIGTLSNLEILDLDFNALSGSIPQELSYLKKLKLLDLNDNGLAGSLDALVGITNIQFLQLHSTYIGGTIPVVFSSFTKLKAFTIQNTYAYGDVPQGVCNLRNVNGGNLEHLYADCAGSNPAVFCPCCTRCFERDDSMYRAGNVVEICGVNEAEREARIRETIFTFISNPITATNELSAQSKALAWITHVDSKRVCHQPTAELIQRYVAAVFYFATEGNDWVMCSHDSEPSLCLSGDPFLSASHECEWGGISCSGDVISEIVFEKNNLAGFLPEEMASLSALKVLSLERGAITGPIPSSIGRLSNLEILDLDFNELSGSIPIEISELKKLKLLDLNDNDLIGSLEVFVGLESIEFLQIHATSMGGTVPQAFGGFSNLKALTLQKTGVYGPMPDAVCQIRSSNGGPLQHLESDCGGEFPPVACTCCTRCFESESPGASYRTGRSDGCSSLAEDERKSAIVELLEEISGDALLRPTSPQSRARDFILNDDPLYLCAGSANLLQRYALVVFYYSTAGDGWNFCSALATTSICTSGQGKRYLSDSHECEWMGISCDDNNMITEIRFSQNNLEGYLPKEISELSRLQSLALEKGLVSGVIPTTISDLWFLEEIDLDNNDIRGPLPLLPPGLKFLDLNDNPNLTGPISGLASLTHLKFVDLHATSVSGSIPQAFGNLADLGQLILHETNLSGAMPTNLCINHIAPGGKPDYISADCNAPGTITDCSCCTCYPRPPPPTPPPPTAPPIASSPTTPPPTSAPVPQPTWNYPWPTWPPPTAPVPNPSATFRQPDPPTRRPRRPPTAPPPTQRRQTPPPPTRPPPTRARPTPRPPTRARPPPTQSQRTQPAPTAPPGKQYSGICQLDSVRREDRIRKRIDNQIGRRRGRVLMPHSSSGGDSETSPTELALEWLISEDPRVLCPNDDSLIQRYVAAVFYYSTHGDGWKQCSSDQGGSKKVAKCEEGGRWMSKLSECFWWGLECDANGQITSISFLENRLHGEIPEEISELTELRVLSLEKGHLKGCIPASLGLLSKLRKLDLDFNRLSCDLPDLSSLNRLETLDLNDNKELKGNLDGIKKLTKLRYVFIHKTKIGGVVPESLAKNSPHLVVVSLHETKISGTMPRTMCALRDDARNGGNLHYLTANCSYDCDCCTNCEG